MSQTRNPFYSEKAFAPKASVIPKRLRLKHGAYTTTELDFVVGELIREAGKYIAHVHAPQPPIHVFGLPPSQLRARERFIVEAAGNEIEAYTRRGKTHTRKQKNTTPLMIGAVASWPEPDMTPTPERDRWQKRFVRLCKSRWGSMVRSVVAHADEGFYHLHAWIDDDGKSMKTCCATHSYVEDLVRANPSATRKEMGQAAKEGGREVQRWYAQWAGKPFGHTPSRTPRARVPRSDAMRDRQAQIESAEEDLAQRKKAAANLVRESVARIESAEQDLARREKAAQAEVLKHAAMIKDALARLQKREANVAALRLAVVDQLAVEVAAARNRNEEPSVF